MPSVDAILDLCQFANFLSEDLSLDLNGLFSFFPSFSFHFVIIKGEQVHANLTAKIYTFSCSSKDSVPHREYSQTKLVILSLLQILLHSMC